MKPRHAGFTLIELAVVMVIVGILLYATLAVGASQLEIARIKSTQNKLNNIQTALDIYYKINNYLPCPADGTQLVTATGATGYGVGQRSGDTSPTTSDAACANVLRDSGSNIYVGVVPVRDLNLPDEFLIDSWGDRITYVVSKNCVDTDNWISTNIYKCSDGATTTANGGKIQVTGQNGTIWSPYAAYAIISHGENGIGSWNRGGTRVVGSASATERANGNLDGAGAALGATAQLLVYYDRVIYDGDTANYFDDIVRWKTAPQIEYDANH